MQKQYGNLPSFQGIQNDCKTILQELKFSFRNQFNNRSVTVNTVGLL